MRVAGTVVCAGVLGVHGVTLKSIDVGLETVKNSEELRFLTDASLLPLMQDVSAAVNSIEPTESSVDSKGVYASSREALQQEMDGVTASFAANTALLNNAVNMDTTGRVLTEHVQVHREMAEEMLGTNDWQKSLLHVFDNAATKLADDAIGGQLKDIAFDMRDASDSSDDTRVVLPKMLAHAPRMIARMASLLVPSPNDDEGFVADLPEEEEEVIYDDVPLVPTAMEFAISPYVRLQMCMPVSINFVNCGANFGVCPKIELILCHVRMVEVTAAAGNAAKTGKSMGEYFMEGWNLKRHKRFIMGLVGVGFTFAKVCVAPFLIFPVCTGGAPKDSALDLITQAKKTGFRLEINWKYSGTLNADAVAAPKAVFKLMFGVGFGVNGPVAQLGGTGIHEEMFVYIVTLNDGTMLFAWNMAFKVAPKSAPPPDDILELAFQLVNSKRQFKVDKVVLQDLMSLKPAKRQFSKIMATMSVTCMSEAK